MLNLAPYEILFDKGKQKHTAGDDKTSDGAGDGNDCATVYATQHGDSPLPDLVATGLLINPVAIV
jgi:hypothetical protein